MIILRLEPDEMVDQKSARNRMTSFKLLVVVLRPSSDGEYFRWTHEDQEFAYDFWLGPKSTFQRHS